MRNSRLAAKHKAGNYEGIAVILNITLKNNIGNQTKTFCDRAAADWKYYTSIYSQHGQLAFQCFTTRLAAFIIQLTCALIFHSLKHQSQSASCVSSIFHSSSLVLSCNTCRVTQLFCCFRLVLRDAGNTTGPAF